MLLDFSALPNKEWASKQPKDRIVNFVDSKSDSGSDQLSIAEGAGISGGNCLAITSVDDRAGLPGFWLMRGRSTGRAVANCKTAEGYLVRPGERANRLSFWIKFPRGFGAKQAASRTSNLVIGTYHFDPAKIGREDVKESDNWHFYHQILIRHDHAQGEWIRVVVNETPQHQRSLSQYRVPMNPTRSVPYWQASTRFYIDCHPYHSEPEIARPVTMLVDGIDFHYEEPLLIDAIAPEEAEVTTRERIAIPVVLKNRKADDVSGIVSHRSRYSWEPRLQDENGADVNGKNITIASGGERTLSLSFHPRSGLKVGTRLPHGLIFVPSDEQRPNNHSISDPRVWLHPSAFGFSGPCDSNHIGATILLKAIA